MLNHTCQLAVRKLLFIANEIPIAVVDATSNTKGELSLRQICYMVKTCVIIDNGVFQEKAGNASTLEKHQRLGHGPILSPVCHPSRKRKDR